MVRYCVLLLAAVDVGSLDAIGPRSSNVRGASFDQNFQETTVEEIGAWHHQLPLHFLERDFWLSSPDSHLRVACFPGS